MIKSVFIIDRMKGLKETRMKGQGILGKYTNIYFSCFHQWSVNQAVYVREMHRPRSHFYHRATLFDLYCC